MQTERLIWELPKGLIKWYEFHKGSRALYVSGSEGTLEPLAEAMEESGLSVDVLFFGILDELTEELRKKFDGDQYDYIVMAGVLEKCKEPQAILRFLYERLNPCGKLLLGVDNRLAIRYFCGDRDPYTERNFDGIENYVRINAADRQQLKGHNYSKAELTEMLEAAGFRQHRFYSVLPELKRPQVMFAEDYLPEEELEVRVAPQYNYPDTVFLEEERLYTTLMQNGLFHAMANGYLIECPLDGFFANVKQITASMERGEDHAMFTVITRDATVEKKAAYEAGREKLNRLMENNLYLKAHNVKMIDACIENGVYRMPYISGEPVTNYFRRLLCQDKLLFLKELDRFWDIICHSSEPVSYEQVNWEQFDPDWQKRKSDDPNKDKWRKIAFGSRQEQENLGVILERGYIDLVSLNCFYIDGEFVFYDQELYVENLPAKAILQRTIQFIYRGNTHMEQILPLREVMERYHLSEYQELWNQFTGHFLNELRNDTQLAEYYKRCRRDTGLINSNRQRMNYSVDEYERLFRDLFRGTEGKQIYLFGSGNFTKKFLSQFGKDYAVAGILDNNKERWGTDLQGIPIMAPEHICSLPVGSYKVIVCIKNFVPVIRQLNDLGVRNYGIYDSNLKYERKTPAVVSVVEDQAGAPKKYHVGYIAGVFDLFHVGHLNMFKRAKEQCDYLIVGVVSDESVMKSKKTMPYIPFEERIEVVRACRYVDEVVEIPTEYSDTDEAYRRYQFDVQFSGSDYADNPIWLAKKAFLQKHGSDMVFFPYTKSTSSTQIKKLIEKKLL